MTTVHPSPMAFAASIAQKTNELQRAMPASDVAALTPPSSSDSNASPTRLKAKDRLIRALFKSGGGSSSSGGGSHKSTHEPSSEAAAHAATSSKANTSLASSLISVMATSNDNAEAKTDRWSMILQRARETGAINRRSSVEIAAAMTTQWDDEDPTTPPGTASSSLKQVLRSKKVKDFIKNAVLVKKFHQSSAPRSIVMEQWVKTSILRNEKLQMREIENGVSRSDGGETGSSLNNSDEFNAGSSSNSMGGGIDNDSNQEMVSAFEVSPSSHKKNQMHGRTLLLEESCRRAFALRGENRSQVDLQALKAWFQMSKLKITTDFERLQPDELDLLCRRMVLINCHAHEVLFRQGDEGDALYIVFSGIVEVRVSQRVRGEKVEVTVCELSRGDFFGERSLLFNEARAATIVMKTPSELVRITREDYNIMLKKDQLEFLHRMHVSNNGTATANGYQTNNNAEYFRILAKKRGTRSKADIDCLKEYVQILKFFRGLPKTFVRELCGIVEFLMLPANTVVFREGETGDLFYIILSGSVDINVNARDIKGNLQQTKLINLTEGSHFGELALMKNHGVRSATVITKEDCQFLTIVGEDYNATLRRMQKEDLTRRIGILDKIPMFQTPEWTSDLLKEMSYVLMEQKLATGTVLFKQGEKALSVFFVMRGELVATKDITDPDSNRTHTVFLERLGQYRVVGEEAAAGSHFNEVFYRDLTVTSSTPVEVLILSKYDVFHRLSRAARETLRSSANVRTESIVYLDRYYKTLKWYEFKQKLLAETLNKDRLGKILPKAAVVPATCTGGTLIAPTIGQSVRPSEARTPGSSASNGSPGRNTPSTTVTTSSTPSTPATTTTCGGGGAHASSMIVPPHRNLNQLVQANEFLLVPPRDKSIATCFPAQDGNLSQYVLALNPDEASTRPMRPLSSKSKSSSKSSSKSKSTSPARPPEFGRTNRFQQALDAEEERHESIMREGNPFAYLDLPRMASSLLLDDPNRRRSSMNTLASVCLPNAVLELGHDTLEPPSVVQFTTSQMMNQFFQDNFIYSLPPSKRRAIAKEQEEAKREEERLQQLRLLEKEKLLAKRKEAILMGDFVLLELKLVCDDEGQPQQQPPEGLDASSSSSSRTKRKPSNRDDTSDEEPESDANSGNKPTFMWGFRIIQSVSSLEEAQRLLMQAGSGSGSGSGPLRHLRRTNTIKGGIQDSSRVSRGGSINQGLNEADTLVLPPSSPSSSSNNTKSATATTTTTSTATATATNNNSNSSWFFVVPKKKFAIVPWSNTNLSAHLECSIHRELYDRYAAKTNGTPHHGTRAHTTTTTDTDETGGGGGGNPWVTQTFGSFRHVRPVMLPMNSSFFGGSRASFLARQASNSLTRQPTMGRHASVRSQIMNCASASNGSTTGGNGANATSNDLDFVESLRAEQLSLGLGHFYAVVSLILPRQDSTATGGGTNVAALAEAVTLMSLHDVFVSEAKAMEFALVMPPLPLKNATLAVIPLTEWIPFEDVMDYVVQIQVARDPRHLLKHQRGGGGRPGGGGGGGGGGGKSGRDSVETRDFGSTSSSSLDSSSTTGTNGAAAGGGGGPSTCASTSTSTSASTSTSPTAVAAIIHNTPKWQQDKQKARKLHQFVCHRMGLKQTTNTGSGGGDTLMMTTTTTTTTTTSSSLSSTVSTTKPTDKKDDHGFTPKTPCLLEDKLRALDEYLQQNQQTRARGTVVGGGANGGAGGGGTGGGGGGGASFTLGKFRQMKRFGSIMKARIAASKKTGIGDGNSSESLTK